MTVVTSCLSAELRELNVAEERSMSTKPEWLAKGESIGATASNSCWEVAQWLHYGEEHFLPKRPTVGGKKAIKIYLANRRHNWEELIAEACRATSLSEVTLRQYVRVARNNMRVEGLSFAHHIEACRAKRYNDKGRRIFDAGGAFSILCLAKEKGWTVAETRREAQLRYPVATFPEPIINKARRALDEILKNTPLTARLEIFEQLADELREQIKQAALPSTESEEDLFGHLCSEDGQFF
jgi:hypothetical protein